MNNRTEEMRKNVLVTPEICVERGCQVTEAYRNSEASPTIIRRAKALENILNNMTIFIQSSELIVGNMASKPRAAPLFPEFGVDFFEEELDSFSKRPYDKFLVNNESKAKIKEIINYWKGKTHCDRVRSLYQIALPPGVKKSWDPARFEINQVIKNRIRPGPV